MDDGIEDRADRFTWKAGALQVVVEAKDTWSLSYAVGDGVALVQDMDGLMQHFLQGGETDLQDALGRFMATPEAKQMPQHLRAEMQNAGVLRD